MLFRSGISIAVENLAEDFRRVGGTRAEVLATPRVSRFVLIGSLQSRYIRQLIKDQKLDVSILKGKSEQYLITTVNRPFANVDEVLVVVGSDRRGAIYGTYELSEQIGVSPWYWWALLMASSRICAPGNPLAKIGRASCRERV